MLLDHSSVDKADSSSPVGGRRVENVVYVEALGVLGRERVELGLEENILVRYVGVDEGELGGIERVLERSTDDLLWDKCERKGYSMSSGRRRTSMGVIPVPPAIMPMALA